MTVRLFNARRLAEELGQGRVSARTKAHYLFAGFAFFVALNVSGLSMVNPLWSWLSFIEHAALILIFLLGFQSAYEAAGGDDNSEFVVQFMCLYVPVSVTTILIGWTLYWGVMIAFKETIEGLSNSRMQFAINLWRIGSSVSGALVTLTVLIVEIVTFYRITQLFHVVRGQSVTPDDRQPGTAPTSAQNE